MLLVLAYSLPSIGTYGNFEIMPMFCPGGFNTCNVTLASRERFRKNNTDVRVWCCGVEVMTADLETPQDASPGYFAQTLDNGIKMEATSTRRAGLERFTSTLR